MSPLVIKPLVIALAAGAALASSALGALAQSKTYDGVWNVLIITEKGSCDRGYRYDIRITNGTVRYSGDAGGINATGKVDGGGRVNVSIGSGEQRASGSGRLSATSGTGTWRGAAASSECSGRWEAERRGA